MREGRGKGGNGYQVINTRGTCAYFLPTFSAFDWLDPAGENDEEIGCCSSSTGQALGGSLRHPECLPIEIPASDTFYRRFGQRCMEFVRSLTAFSTDCRLGAREQVS